MSSVLATLYSKIDVSQNTLAGWSFQQHLKVRTNDAKFSFEICTGSNTSLFQSFAVTHVMLSSWNLPHHLEDGSIRKFQLEVRSNPKNQLEVGRNPKSQLEVGRNPKNQLEVASNLKTSITIAVVEHSMFIEIYHSMFVQFYHTNLKIQLEVASNPKSSITITIVEHSMFIQYFHTNMKIQLEVASDPKTSISNVVVQQSMLIEIYHSLLISVMKSAIDFIAQFALKAMFVFYLHLIHASILSWCLDIHCHLKLVKALSLQLCRFCIARHDYVEFVKRILGQAPISVTCMFASLIYPIQLLLFLQIVQMNINIALHCTYNIQTITCWYDYDTLPFNFYIPRREIKNSFNVNVSSPIGGGKKHMHLKLDSILPFLITSDLSAPWVDGSTILKYVNHLPNIDLANAKVLTDKYACILPLEMLKGHLTLQQMLHIAKLHDITKVSRKPLYEIEHLLAEHICVGPCKENITVLEAVAPICTKAEQRRKRYHTLKKATIKENNPEFDAIPNNTVLEKDKLDFPPRPPSERLLHKIITGFVADTSPSQFVEAGCASCGQLTPIKQLKNIDSLNFSLEPLRSQDNGLTRLERKSVNEPINEIKGPVIAHGCKKICHTCCKHLKKGKTPPLSLANGLWLGEVPSELSNLTYVEQLLISRVRHNRCIIKVASGRYKMRANAISFTNPVPKIYKVLPPSISELDEVLAFIFTGPCQPTKADIERTPMLVRRNRVADALNWLKLNHCDYTDLVISDKNLLQYPEHDTPVVIDYRESVLNKDKEATSVHDNEDEDGVQEGPCSFVVQGLTGDEYSTMSIEAMKARALEHLMKDGKIMFVGHSKDPLTIFKNPRMFPSMFPWLFPYGLGGLAQSRFEGKLSSSAHKRYLLMYYDKRFQIDPNFPLIAFNHEQIQQSSTGSFLTAEKPFFSDITDRLLNIDLAVLTDINKRLSTGERVKPETEEEKACYKLMADLDAIGGHVEGSLAKKKYM